MSRLRSDWDKTWQGRFVRWFRYGTESLDDRMIEALKQDADTSIEESEIKVHIQRAALQADRYAHEISTEGDRYSLTTGWLSARGAKIANRLYALLSVSICLVVIFFLLLTVVAMPMHGDPHAPANNEVIARYIEKGMDETGAVNIVAGMILDYRAFDTLGESTVLFVAVSAVLILLRIDRGPDGEPTYELIAADADDRHYEPKNDRILQGSALVLTPIVLLFGIYIVLNGHLSPGGGFSGGSILGAGLILYLNAFGFQKSGRFFTYRTFQYVSLFSLSFYAISKAYSFYCGANGIPSGIPLGTPGDILSSGLILPLNICVGMVVTCTMYMLYALFRKGGL